MLKKTFLIIPLAIVFLTAFPLTAQETPEVESVIISHKNISFELPLEVAEPGEIEVGEKDIPEEPEAVGPWGGTPGYVEFRFDAETYLDGVETFLYPAITVYNGADFAEFDPEYSDYPYIFAAVQALMEEQPEFESYLTSRVVGGTLDPMPALPIQNAVQLLVGKPEYVEFEGGTGIRFLTMYVQDMVVFSSYSLYYTFQGITEDGRYYISAIFPVMTPGLPTEAEAASVFYEDYEAYLIESLAIIDAQPAADFEPSLEALDTIMSSLRFED